MDKLKASDLVELISDSGPLSEHIKGFEARPQQKEMLEAVTTAYNDDQIALVEAGTGTGKSLAYLLPAVMWALKNGQRSVISTNTINLQEQLLHKDVPLLKKALGVDFRAVLVKGMGNYLCLRKLQDASEERTLLPLREAEEIAKITAWGSATRTGSKTDLPSPPMPVVWERVCVEGDMCNHMGCPFYKECFYFKARRQAADAQILVVNHHLLFADLAMRAEAENYGDQAILPSYHRIIFDEAHHMEDIATEYFADKISRLALMRTLARLGADKVVGRLLERLSF